MTHESESDLEDRLEELFVDHLDPDVVHRQHIFPESNRRADFLVEAPILPEVHYAGYGHYTPHIDPPAATVIEVESRASELIAGLGQVLVYAAHDPSYAPLLMVADDHEIEFPELAYVRMYAPVLTESDLRDRLTDAGGESDD